MFAKALKGQNIEDLLSNLSAAPVVSGAPVAAAGAPALPAKAESTINPIF